MSDVYPVFQVKQPAGRFERRGLGRFAPLPIVFCKVELCDDGTNIVGDLTDISTDGFGLAAADPIPSGTVLSVTLFNTPGLFSCKRTAVVRNVRSRPQGRFHIGCEFDAPLDSRAMRFLHA